MLITTNAIVLSKIKYRDNDLIVTCYTQKFGIVSYILRNVSSSKKGHSKTAYFQLLSQLQLVTLHKNNRSLQEVKEVKIHYMYASLQTHVIKGSIAFFLAETLAGTLKEEERNDTLFSYLETTLQWLDTNNEYANFHLLFLLKLTKHLGFFPEQAKNNETWFNLQEGRFEKNKTNIYTITGENIILLKDLLGTNFDELNAIKINSNQRQSFLKMMLLYFELHLEGFKKPQSLQIFNQVFNS
ncbi:DNA repair protein RecO [Xanthomarina sp. F2636L]|uniref:DNA repair protein RecO n=1 Tax=Xanthomarina sp. F2636L TaxID=2996018 RepID=UPI00225E268C|nr:DNA repair protein RecO [Xanthomarina sp. F2636L]MCX7551143.1 DNA repair protein RecO [Xanthomarina sp. F2636L]